MTAIPLKDETLRALKGKVVVISGSAHGIGASTVALLHSHGAKVFHGDWDTEGGQGVDSSLSSSPISGGETTFVRTDVTDYDSVLNLFDTAWNKYKRIDIAISNAGVQETWDWFDPRLDLESIKIKPQTKTLDVNLTGTVYFAHIAATYLKAASKPTGPKSLILVSSTAGFKETPGLFTYSASKHGVVGLVRSLRLSLPKTHNINVNAVCPWMTDTVMVDGIRENWVRERLPVNSPESVGRIMLELAVGKDGEDKEWNGRAVFVEGGRGWDIEEGIDKTEEQWLGKEVAERLNRGQDVLGDGTDWTKPESKVH